MEEKMEGKDYLLTDVLQEFIADDSWGESVEQRAAIAYGIIYCLFS